MAATIWEYLKNIVVFFLKKVSDGHTMIMPWIMATMPRDKNIMSSSWYYLGHVFCHPGQYVMESRWWQVNATYCQNFDANWRSSVKLQTPQFIYRAFIFPKLVISVFQLPSGPVLQKIEKNDVLRDSRINWRSSWGIGIHSGRHTSSTFWIFEFRENVKKT